jgi:hypothetical protein
MDQDRPVTYREFQDGLAAVEQRMDQRMAAMEERITDRFTELARDIETNLLTAFHGYGRGQSSRMHTVESGQTDLSQRMAALEDRVLALETRPRQ